MNLRSFPFVAVSLICTTHLLAQTPEEPPEVHQESGTTVVNGEWFIGADPGLGNGTPIAVQAGKAGFDVPTMDLEPGAHQLYVRFRDDLGQWSFPELSPLVVLPVVHAESIEWRVIEDDAPVLSGRQSLSAGDYPAMSEIVTDSFEAEALDREFRFEVRLILEEDVPTGWIQQTFEVQEPPVDLDTDADGILDRFETGTGIFVSAADTGTDPLKTDSDGDGLPDGVEVGSPLDPNHDDTPIIEFFAERTRQLNLPAPLIERGEDGLLNLRLRLETSQDLREWFKLILGEQSISVDDGEIVVALPGEVEGTQFFLLRPQD